MDVKMMRLGNVALMTISIVAVSISYFTIFSLSQTSLILSSVGGAIFFGVAFSVSYTQAILEKLKEKRALALVWGSVSLLGFFTFVSSILILATVENIDILLGIFYLISTVSGLTSIAAGISFYSHSENF